MTRSTVIANEQVVDAHRTGRSFLEVHAGDIITAQARETADRLNIQLLDHPLEKPPHFRPDGITSMRRILYRRHPAWVPPRRHRSICPEKLEKLVIVGVGGVGANTAHLCVNLKLARHIVLIDVLPGLAESTALDLEHARGLTRASIQISGGQDMGLVADADLVIVTAGQPRTPGMKRLELIGSNARIIRSVGTVIADIAATSVVIVVSNPLDEMTCLMCQVTGFPRNQVLGMAGTLDSCRYRIALAAAAGVNVADVEAIMLGSHDEAMVPVVSRATICDRPLTEFLDPEQIQACRDRTVSAGASVVALRKKGSATIAPAHAIVELIDHIRGAIPGPVPVSVLLSGEYGIEDSVVSVPCILGRSGVLEIVELPLQDDELDALRTSARAVRERLESSP